MADRMSDEQRALAEHLVLDFKQMRDFARDPFVVVKGDGIRVTDAQGRSYIDGLSGVFVVGLGHNNRAIIDAVTEQLSTLAFAPPLHGTNDRALELAALLADFAPAGLRTYKFLSGGSEATETAMKLAKQYHQQTGHPRKFKIISRYGAYHGATMGALSATGGWERKSVFEPLGVGYIHVHPPYCYRCPYDKAYPSCGITCAKLVERTIRAEDPETVAAVIMEPISISSAGFVVPPKEFFAELREACTRHGVLLVFDEIITGFGRLGEKFAADYYGVKPDIICCGKGMSGGYAPLSAVLFADWIHEAFLGEVGERREFHHGHTYGGNPLACAAGVAALKQILDRKLVDNSRSAGRHLRERLREMGDRHSIVGDVRGAGLLQGVELVKDRQTRESFGHHESPGRLIDRLARERGLILRCGHEFVAFAPPLIVTRDEIDEMCSILDECVGLAQRQLLPGKAP